MIAKEIREMDTSTDRLSKIIGALGLAYKEGFDIEEYVSHMFHRARTYDENIKEENGHPVRKLTFLFRLDRLEDCGKLLNFVNQLSACSASDRDFAFEVNEDLEASAYLAAAGHYRQAIAILRFGCENALLDQYYELHPGYEDWKNGEVYVLSGAKLVDSVFPEQTLINARLKSHVRLLSKYVHVKTKGVTNQNIWLEFDEGIFDIWYSLFLESTILIAQTLTAYTPLRCRPKWDLLWEVTGLTREDMMSGAWSVKS